MKELDRKIFGSWPILVSWALVFGFLFSIAMSLIELLFEGMLRYSRENAMVGVSVAAVFLLISTWVRFSIRRSERRDG